jgi:superoxide dismutase
MNFTSLTCHHQRFQFQSSSLLQLNCNLDHSTRLKWHSWKLHQRLQQLIQVFGSCWVFLVYLPEDASLSIVSTANQDIPEFSSAFVGTDCVSILGLDVWEHAYYLRYQNVRNAYLEAWWQVVDWNNVNDRLQAAFSMFDESE